MISQSISIRFAAVCFRFVLASFLNSKTYTYLLRFSEILQAAFFNSASYRFIKMVPCLYPGQLWQPLDSLNTRFKGSFLSKNIFNPIFIFPFVYLSFIAVSSYRISNLGLFSILIGILFFVFSFLRFKIDYNKIYLEDRAEKVAVLLLTVGVLSLVYDVLQAGAVPLFDPAAKRHLSVTFTMLSTLIVPGGILTIAIIGRRFREKKLELKEARMYAIFTLIATTGLIALLGYRTQIIVSLLGCSIAMYMGGSKTRIPSTVPPESLRRVGGSNTGDTRLIGLTEILLVFFSAIFAISLLGYYRGMAEGSSVGFFEIIARRVGLTLSVYDYLINRFWPFGVNHGTTMLATFSSFFHFIPGPRLGPRTIVARMFGVQDISMTSTLLGTVVLDFGIVGIIAFMAAFGGILKMAYTAAKTNSAVGIAIFAFLLSYSLVGIETGLVDFNVFVFFAGSFLILVNSRKCVTKSFNNHQ